jgi:hypothetical protein
VCTTIIPPGSDSYPSAPYKQFRSLLALRVETSLPRHGTVEGDEAEGAQHTTMSDLN